MNLIAGQSNNTSATPSFNILGGSLPLSCPALGSPVLLGLRPEHITLSDDAAWRGEVSLVEPTGADTYVVVKTAVGIITVRTAPNVQVKPGDQVGLAVSAAHASWFDAKTGVRI